MVRYLAGGGGRGRGMQAPNEYCVLQKLYNAQDLASWH